MGYTRFSEVERITGTSFNDEFYLRGVYFQRGLGGADRFLGTGIQATTFDGGAGQDEVAYSTWSGQTRADTTPGIEASLLRGRGWSGPAEGDRFIGIENLRGAGATTS